MAQITFTPREATQPRNDRKPPPMNRTCPITGQPLNPNDPAQIVSKEACKQLQHVTKHLATTMNCINQILQGAGKPPQETSTHTRQPFPPAPLNLHAFTAIDDARDTIDIWANNLAQHANPTLRYNPGDWHTIQAIFQTYAHHCQHWQTPHSQPGILCIQRVTNATQQLTNLINPPTTTTNPTVALEQLKNKNLPIRQAAQTLTLLTGKHIPTSTIRSWKHRGHITTTGNPPRYNIQQLLTLCNTQP